MADDRDRFVVKFRVVFDLAAGTHQGDATGTGQLANAVRTHQFDERLDLFLLTGDFDQELVLADIDHPAAEDLNELEEFRDDPKGRPP